jgi:hypothetical protein
MALLPFGSMYLYEKFSAMAGIAMRQRNCLQLELDVILAISTVPPRIENLISSEQAHVCH